MNPSNMEEEIVKRIRAVLLPNKSGLVLSALETEYRGMIGECIPYTELGHPSLLSFLKSIPDHVHLTKLSGGSLIVVARSDESTKHISDLVRKQKVNPEGIRNLNVPIIFKDVCFVFVQDTIEKLIKCWPGTAESKPGTTTTDPEDSPIRTHQLLFLASSEMLVSIMMMVMRLVNLGVKLQVKEFREFLETLLRSWSHWLKQRPRE